MRNFILATMIVLFGIAPAFADSVTDDNNGNSGYIFVSTGENHGDNSVGKWVDPNCIIGLKGEKGDTGATGAQGIQGIQGVKGDTGAQGIQGLKGNTGATGAQGIQGVTGKDGKDGINGINGVNGTNGVNGKDGAVGATGDKGNTGDTGAKGDKGDKGNTGTNGTNGVDGAKGDKGDIGATGATGEKGENGKDVDPAIVNAQNEKINSQNDRINTLNKKVSKLEKTQGIIGAEVRVYDGKKWTVTTFVDFTATRNTVDRAGVRFTYKLGKSYEEQRIDELEAKLKHIASFSNGQAEQPAQYEMYTDGGSIGIKERF